MSKPWVVIEVSGGVAEISASSSGVEVLIVDWDNLKDEGISLGDVAEVLLEVLQLPGDWPPQLVRELVTLVESKAKLLA